MNFLVDSGMAIGPVLGYIHQYFLIKMEKSVGTFSIDICGILLFANILRLNFYIFNRYELALFFQSIFMISAQICLVYICTKYSKKKSQIAFKSESESLQNVGDDETEKPQQIWRWTSFSKYLRCIASFAFLSFSVSIIFKRIEPDPYQVLIGLVALLSQSMLIFPQIVQNYKKKSAKGLSRILVALNLTGDILKLIYFLVKRQSFQFVMCGIIQIILDSFVVIQILYYKKTQNEFQKNREQLVSEKQMDPSAQPQTQSEENFEQKQQKIQNQRPDQFNHENILPINLEVCEQQIQTSDDSDKIIIQGQQCFKQQSKPQQQLNAQQNVQQKYQSLIEELD